MDFSDDQRYINNETLMYVAKSTSITLRMLDTV